MKKFTIIFTLLILIVPVIAFAQVSSGNPCTGGAESGNIPRCINQVYMWSMGAAALLALIMIVIGGYITLTSAGNAQQASKGKNYIYSSLVGLVLLFGAYILLRTINPNLVDFRDNCANNPNSAECFGTQNPNDGSTPAGGGGSGAN